MKKSKAKARIAARNARAFMIVFPGGGWVKYGKMKKDGSRKVKESA